MKKKLDYYPYGDGHTLSLFFKKRDKDNQARKHSENGDKKE